MIPVTPARVVGALALLGASGAGAALLWGAARPPEPPPAAVAPAPAAPAPAEVLSAAARAPAPAAQPAPRPDPPRFDVVRVGARGRAVVAGRAPPGSEVVLLDGGREIGRARADQRGEWVILPEEPLGAGARELSLLARLPGGVELAGADTAVVAGPAPVLDAAEPRGEGASPVAGRNETRGAGATTLAAAPTTGPPYLAAPVPPAAEAPPPTAPPARPERAEVRDPAGPGASAATTGPAGASPMVSAPALSQPPVSAPPSPAPPVPAVPLPEAVAAVAPPLVAPAGTPAPAAAPGGPVVMLLPGDPSAAPRRLGGGGTALGLDVVDYDERDLVRFAGSAPPGARLRLYADGRHLGDVLADEGGRWSLVPETPPAVGRHLLRVDQLVPGGAAVAARIALPFHREALPGVPGDGRVVVQPGQNLWRLARAAYGRGVRYTVIFEANRDQIRDPRRIYPGQVFSVPSGP